MTALKSDDNGNKFIQIGGAVESGDYNIRFPTFAKISVRKYVRFEFVAKM